MLQFKNTFIILKIVTLICSILGADKSCNEFYDNLLSSLTVEEGDICTVKGKEPWLTNYNINMYIRGVLKIELEESISLRHVKIDFGEKGELRVNQTNSQSQLVIEQSVPTIYCFLNTQKKGKISVYSQSMYGYSEIFNVEKGQGHQKLKVENTAEITFNQSVAANIFHSEIRQDDVYSISQVQNRRVALNNTLPLDVMQFRSSIIPKPILIHLNHESFGVIFKNSCLSTKIDTISGVAFIDPIRIEFEGTLITNTLFYNTKHISESKIALNSNLESSTFKNIQYLNVSISENMGIRNNLFVGINNSILDLKDTSLSQNIFIYSFVSFQISNQHFFEFRDLKIQNSLINILNQNNSSFIMNSIFHFNSTTKFSQDLNRLTMDNVTSINSQFNLEEIKVHQHLLIERSYFYSDMEEHIGIVVSSRYCSEINNSFNLNITQSYIVNHPLEEFITCNTHSIELESGQSEFMHAHVLVFLKDCNIKRPKREYTSHAPIRNQSKIRVFTKQTQLLEYVKIPYSNQIRGDMKESPQIGDGYYLGRQAVSYFKIKSIRKLDELTDDSSMQIVNNGVNILSSDWRNKWLQILHNDKFSIIFLNSNQQTIDLQTIALEIVNIIPSILVTRNFQISFSSTQRAIKHISGVLSIENQDITFTLNQKQKFMNYQSLFSIQLLFDKIYISWEGSECRKVNISLKLYHCEKEQYLFEDQCILECTHFTQKNVCVSYCERGYYSDPNGKICQSCPDGCLYCEDGSSCLTCQLGYYYLEGHCYSSCPPGYFEQSSNYCEKCNIGCERCLDFYTCLECNSKQGNCFIQQNQGVCPVECIECNSSCNTCIDNSQSKISCLECSFLSTDFFGECI